VIRADLSGSVGWKFKSGHNEALLLWTTYVTSGFWKGYDALPFSSLSMNNFPLVPSLSANRALSGLGGTSPHIVKTKRGLFKPNDVAFEQSHREQG
jgi:hypothetical protein